MQDDIHHSKKNLEAAIKRIEPLNHGDVAIEFLQHLQASGLTPVRVLKYATCLPRILNSVDIQAARKKEIERFVFELSQSDYKAWTKQGYKVTLKSSSTSKTVPPQRIRLSHRKLLG